MRVWFEKYNNDLFIVWGNDNEQHGRNLKLLPWYICWSLKWRLKKWLYGVDPCILNGYRFPGGHRWIKVKYKHIWRTLCTNCGFMFNHTRRPWFGVLVDWP